MTIDPTKLTQAIYDTIFDSMTVAPPGLMGRPAALDRDKFYMTLALPGTMVNVADVANPWSPNNPTGSQASLEYMSGLVDAVPIRQVYHVPNGSSAEDQYAKLIGGRAVDPPLSPDEQKAYDAAYNLLNVDGSDFDDEGKPITVKVDSPIYTKYKKARKAYDDAMTAYLSNYLTYDLATPDGQRKWALLGPRMQAAVDSAWNDMQNAQATRVEQAIATLAQGKTSLTTLLSNAQRNFAGSVRGRLDGGGNYHTSYAVPGNWFTDAAAQNFTQVTIDSKSLRQNESSRMMEAGGSSGIDVGLWGVKASASHTQSSSQKDSATKNLRIDFKFARVDVRRNWLDASLFGLSGIRIDGMADGALADGLGDGPIGLLPTAFIVARDVKISADWGSEDLKQAQSANSAEAKVSYGPFSISGHYKDSASSRAFKSDFDGRTITIPGLQIIAYLHRIIPRTPAPGIVPTGATPGSVVGTPGVREPA